MRNQAGNKDPKTAGKPTLSSFGGPLKSICVLALNSSVVCTDNLALVANVTGYRDLGAGDAGHGGAGRPVWATASRSFNRPSSAPGPKRRLRVGQSMSALPGYFNFNLFRYSQGVIYFDAYGRS
jgi:hypothetical protein